MALCFLFLPALKFDSLHVSLFIKKLQVLLPRLHACHQLKRLCSHLPFVRAKTPHLGFGKHAASGKHAAGRGKGSSMQHPQLAWECGWHPLTPSPLFPPHPPEELRDPQNSCLLLASTTFPSNSLHMLICLSSTPAGKPQG